MSCDNSLTNQLKKEVQEIKNQCPQSIEYGVTMTDVNFYESNKVIEYICSIDGVEYIRATTVDEMKKLVIKTLSSDVSKLEKFSIKILLNQDYRLRYIYTNTKGKKLCEINITKHDLP